MPVNPPDPRNGNGFASRPDAAYLLPRWAGPERFAKLSSEAGAGVGFWPGSVAERRLARNRATDTAHNRLEVIVQSGNMFGAIDGCRRCLAATWIMVDQFERLLDASAAASLWPGWPRRQIAGPAVQDITDLGIPDAAARINLHSTLADAELLGVL